MSTSPTINVWTLGRGPRGQWTLQHTTPDLDEAAALFEQLDGQGQQVALYEIGLFEHEGRRVAGQVGFWWSANLNGYMEMEPEGRGAGWSDEFDTYVHYEPLGSAANEPTRAQPGPRFAGQSMPVSDRLPNGSPMVGHDVMPSNPSQIGRTQLLWSVFILPGKILLWIEYMFPGRGQVWASSRRYGNPVVEVLYAAGLWVVALICILVWTGSGGK